jgi:hypothetical protein
MAKQFLATVFWAALGVVAFASFAQAGPMTQTIGIKFGADDPPGVGSMLAPDQVAGVPGVRTANWNNATGATNLTGILLQRDDFGMATTSGASVTWSSSNTWSSTGRGEENNMFVQGPGTGDRSLMTGYLDDNPGMATTITIKNLPPDFALSDVYLYFLGGVGTGRFGDYTVNGITQFHVGGDNSLNGPAYVQAVGNNSTGNFLLFHNVTGFELDITVATDNAGFRSPINAVEIVALPPLSPQAIIPEPTSLALVGVGLAGLLAYGWRRRRGRG